MSKELEKLGWLDLSTACPDETFQRPSFVQAPHGRGARPMRGAVRTKELQTDGQERGKSGAGRKKLATAAATLLYYMLMEIVFSRSWI